MEQLFINVDWSAVAVGFVVAFGLGWLWYSDIMFGEKWRAGIGIDPQDQTTMLPAMVSQAVGTFLLAWVVGITETTNAWAFALLIAVTIALIIKANGFFTQKSKFAIMVESGYIIVMVLVMLGVHAVV